MKKRTPFKNLSTIEKIYFILTIIFEISIIIAIIISLIRQNWLSLFVAVLTFLLILYPLFFERRYQIKLPNELNLIAILFIYFSLYLGEIHKYYTKLWWWDIILHTSSGIVLGFIGFGVLFILYKRQKVNASPIILAIFSFCFALAIGSVWEIFEFSMDQFFGLNMQKSGLRDTMWDLIVDSGGALIASAIGFIYLKTGKKGILDAILKKFIKENPNLIKI